MPQPTIIAVGELLVEFISHKKGCELRNLAEYSGPYPSGAPAICIDQVARLGMSSKIFGGLGEDNFGNSLIDRLRTSGVDTSDILKIPNKSTGVAFVSYFDNGSRTFIFHLNNTAADAFSIADVNLPSGALILHVSGSSLGNQKIRSVIKNTVDEVIKRGGKISCDPNARAELMSDMEAREVLIGILEKSTYLFPSTSDLEFLFPGKTETAAIESLLAYRPELIALKRGEAGSVIFSDGEVIVLPGHNVEEVDPTGAGDCFCGTFLATMAQGYTPEKAGRYANAAGALAVMKRGPMEGNSNFETIESFLETSSPAIETQKYSND